MIKKKIGQVSEREKNEILVLYERIVALEEVSLTIDRNDLSLEQKDKLILKINNEIPLAKQQFMEWWNKKVEKYGWEKNDKEILTVDFNTNEIFLKQE